MSGQPITAMAGVTVPRSADSKADQHPATGLVMTKGAAIAMDTGDGIRRVATLAGVIACGDYFGSMGAIDMAVRISGAMAGVTVIEGIWHRHSLTQGDANQGDGGGGTDVAGRTAIVKFGVSGTRRKYR